MTKRLVLIGDPVLGSRSPEIQKALLRLAGIPGTYTTRRVDRAGVVSAVEDLRRGDVDGLNVTMPHKTVVAQVVDHLDGFAAMAGSVNTVARVDSSVYGFSTDAVVLAELINDAARGVPGAVHILGSGGSARAALAAVEGILPVYLSGRNASSVGQLASEFGATEIGWGVSVAGSLVVNTTPLGMRGEELPSSVVRSSSVLIDLPYSDTLTPAVRLASTMGISSVDGHEFLMRQAIASFEIWTGTAIRYVDLVAEL